MASKIEIILLIISVLMTIFIVSVNNFVQLIYKGRNKKLLKQYVFSEILALFLFYENVPTMAPRVLISYKNFSFLKYLSKGKYNLIPFNR